MDQTPMNQRKTQRAPAWDGTLYDGDGENVRVSSGSAGRVRRPSVVKAAQPGGNPGRQPLGRVEELRGQRAAEPRRAPEREAPGRLFPDREDGAVYDDFDVYDEAEGRVYTTREKPPRRRDPHRGLWLTVIFLCALCLAAVALFAAPQVFGVQFRMLPNYAFVNGSLITLDAADYSQYRAYRKYMTTQTIYPGVYIDGVSVGNMTRDEAVSALSAVDATWGGNFAITVNIGNKSWSIDSDKVPMTRSLEQAADQAYAMGRSNTTAIRGTRVTPFQERLNAALALRENPVNLTTSLTYDRDAIRTLTDSIATYVNRDPVNASVATFDFNTRGFTFNSDTPGAYVDPDELYAQVVGKLDKGEYTATLTVEPEVILAAVTKAELMNSFKKISSYTTETTSNENRNTNVMLSAAAINGTTVMPGETFSFNATTGERTEAKGYREAIAISGGQSVPDIGGGVCQTSSTLFNAVARADLEIVYRSPHAWPSSYVEKGMDATVNWPSLDFKFKNDKDWPVFIVAWYEKRKVTVELYGMSLGDGVSIDLESEVVKTIDPPSGINYVQNAALAPGESKTTIKARTGYVVDTYKVWYQNGTETGRELLCESKYKAYQETVEYN